MRKTCHDCGVKIGEYHKEWCDAPSCTICGIQLLQCNHWEKGNSKFTGEMYPEERKICRELGLYCRSFVNGKPVKPGEIDANKLFDPNYKVDWFVPCNKDDYGAHPDINRATVIYQQRCMEMIE